MARHNVARNRIAADSTAVDPRRAVLHREIVKKVASAEVVAAVENEVHAANELLGVTGYEVGDIRLDDDIGVCSREPPHGSDSFGQALFGVSFLEDNLPLQIVKFDVVTIDDAQLPDPSPDQERREHAAGRATADQSNARRTQVSLAFFAYGGEKNLA